MFKEIGVILEKEIKRVLTDKRLVITTFVIPAVSIFIIYSMMGMMIGRFINDIEKHSPTVYLINAPANFKTLVDQGAKENQMKLTYLNGEPGDSKMSQQINVIKSDVLGGKTDLLVIFPKDFSEKVIRYESKLGLPQITTFYNPSEEYSSKARNDIFNKLFSKYESQLLGERLGNANYVKVFEVDLNEKASQLVDEKKAAGKGLGNLLPFLITIFLISGAMGLGMESIAGEKERGTMATMLVTPVRRDAIAYGKIISLGIFALLSALSSFAGIMASMPFASKMIMPDHGGSGEMGKAMALPFGFGDFAMLLAVMLSMVAIFVAVVCVLSLYAKSVKEAGTYVTPFYMVVMLAGTMTMFNNDAIPFWHYAIPVYGGIMSIKSIFLFQYSLAAFGVTLLVSFITVVGLVYLIKAMFNNERIIFNQ